jgi:hypothetical protein
MFFIDAVNKPDKKTTTHIQMLPFSLHLTLSLSLPPLSLSLFPLSLFLFHFPHEEQVNQQEKEKIAAILMK